MGAEKTPMANDHYVARTYLKHFAGATDKLHGVKKTDGKSFPCAPKDICAELDGDIIPDLLTDEKYLGKFRATFEKEWDRAVAAVEAKTPTEADKLHIAGYWANLMICTPTFGRVGTDLINKAIELKLRAQNILGAENGQPEHLLAEGIEAMDRGELKVSVDPDEIRAFAAAHAMKYAWQLYNADWQVFENKTATDFVTSDNPASYGDSKWGQRDHFQILPITPKLCLMCDLTKKPELRDTAPDFTKPSQGKIEIVDVPLETVERINTTIAKSAESLLLSSGETQYVKDLAAKYSKFRVENESTMTRQGKGFVIAHRARVIERTDQSTQK
jgi:hypothetical protein